MNIVLFEVQEGPRASLVSLLQRAGHEVKVVRGGNEHHLEVPHDVLVFNRDEGLRIVRALRVRNNDDPILLVTSGNTAEDRIEGLKAGADDCIDRGLPIDELVARLLAVVRRGRPGSYVSEASGTVPGAKSH